MILIISKEQLEVSTEDVMDWLYSFNKKVTRINGDDSYKSDGISARFSSERLKIKFPYIDLDNEYAVIWYRRWSDRMFLEKLKEYSLTNQEILALSKLLSNDETELKKLLFSQLKSKHWFTTPSTTSASKPLVLNKCIELGIRIPETLITGKKDDVTSFLNENGRIICKDIAFPFIVYEPGRRLFSFTKEITKSVLDSLPDTFMPSLFQELIEKEYEIRAFYLDGTFYCMAIFSQSDEQTSVDFRKYNVKKPNRNVPYKLPIELEEKLKALMKTFNYPTGSLDLIRTKSGEYVFLEINPVGQFGMTSHPCNYYLEKKIAEYLAKYDQ